MNLRRAMILTMLSLGLFSCAGTGGGEADSADRHTAQVNASLGREYMSRGQYEVALEKLKKAISADDDYAPGHTLIAILYEQIGEQDLAARHYRRAVELQPDNGDVNNNYGVFLCGIGRAVEAEPYFLKAVADPFYTTPEVAFANAGSCMVEASNLENAEIYLRKSLNLRPNFPDALYNLAMVEFRNGDYLGARAFLQRFEATGTESAESLWLGMRVERALNNEKSAAQYRARLLNRYPDSAEARQADRGN